MNRNVISVLISIMVIIVINCSIYGWDGKTHRYLTKKAVLDHPGSILENYLQDVLSMEEGIYSKLWLNQNNIPPNEWIPSDQFANRIMPFVLGPTKVIDLLMIGSELEDYPTPRAKHHFHDPWRNRGLDNQREHPDIAETIDYLSRKWFKLSFDLTGASAYRRAVGIEAPDWNDEYENFFNWPSTREYFYRSLNKESPEAREHYLALTFISLGHVLHLLEDMGVPPHARNDFVDAHFRSFSDYGNPLEKYIEEKIAIFDQWFTNWTPSAKIFSKVSDYFDSSQYVGQYVGSNPLPQWGLSEKSNYQFFSNSTILRQDIDSDYYFPHPAEQYLQEASILAPIPVPPYTVNLRNIYGYDVPLLAVQKYICKYASPVVPKAVGIKLYYTTFDENVYQSYAPITLPRTVDYITGLTNYFFRGKLSVENVTINGTNLVADVRNISKNSTVEQTLVGGKFELYWDDADDNRTKLSEYPVSQLNYNQTTQITFPYQSDAKQYVVVYKGNICENENPSNLDYDDENTALAVSNSFEDPYSGIVTMCWIDESEGGLYSYRPDNTLLYDGDLDAYRNMLDSASQFIISGCLVPNTTIGYILPDGYSPPEEISIETCGRPPTESELIADFDRIRESVVPEYLLLIVDNSGSMTTGDIQPGYSNFKSWVETNYPDTTIIEIEFDDERWINEITTQVQNILD